ncbi:MULTISPECIES: hypothetical protein [unclassified Amycolatopsis]|uniref:hypothetical protein n=1 Tax=unclassified Amycolatopsis TaxID=2618356 RepID=UPI00106F05C3|nr:MULTISPECIES: hypothetical protein [unclassified Amycolatopsis]
MSGRATRPKRVACARLGVEGATQPQLAAHEQPDAATTQPKSSAKALSERSPLTREQAVTS